MEGNLEQSRDRPLSGDFSEIGGAVLPMEEMSGSESRPQVALVALTDQVASDACILSSDSETASATVLGALESEAPASHGVSHNQPSEATEVMAFHASSGSRDVVAAASSHQSDPGLQSEDVGALPGCAASPELTNILAVQRAQLGEARAAADAAEAEARQAVADVLTEAQDSYTQPAEAQQAVLAAPPSSPTELAATSRAAAFLSAASEVTTARAIEAHNVDRQPSGFASWAREPSPPWERGFDQLGVTVSAASPLAAEGGPAREIAGAPSLAGFSWPGVQLDAEGELLPGRSAGSSPASEAAARRGAGLVPVSVRHVAATPAGFNPWAREPNLDGFPSMSPVSTTAPPQVIIAGTALSWEVVSRGAATTSLDRDREANSPWRPLSGSRLPLTRASFDAEEPPLLQRVDDLGPDGAACVICLSPEARGAVELGCGHRHRFHFRCIVDWCCASGGPATCPLCRSLLLVETAPP